MMFRSSFTIWIYSIIIILINQKTNKAIECLAKNGSYNTDSNIWIWDFPKKVSNIAFKESFL